ncbi:MAG TPA: Bax inhibitor-1 family protein, partial [Myxococcaceae bacterium]|nr:Bax inhibitor-1 family protein [Myxococcaceae bacterium]
MAWEFDARRAARDGRDLGEAGSFGRELTGTTAASFMAGVYRWMTLGLAVTAGVALYTASNGDLAETVRRIAWPLVGAQFLVVLVLSFLAQRISGPIAALLFMVYAGLTGLTFSGLFFY